MMHSRFLRGFVVKENDDDQTVYSRSFGGFADPEAS